MRSTTALRLKQDWPEALVRRADALKAKGRTPEALADVRRALEVAAADWPERAAWESAVRSWANE